jgi:prepilin-type N-terminal cleavage/methylation domain-containing protein
MHHRGFTLVEVLIALGILAVAALSSAQLIVITCSAIQVARLQTSTVALSSSRMEQLRALTWGFDSNGLPTGDSSTNLSVEPPASDGTGLAFSPAGSLQQNTPGFVDFLDSGGRWMSAGPAPPPAAAYLRRWSIEPPADGSPDTLVIQVVTRPIAATSAARAESRLLSVLTRIAP